jgi:3-phenylpropionate/trans-cinnamate dioxygenase ferredoxin reductase subunit
MHGRRRGVGPVTAGLVVIGGGPAGLEAARAYRDGGGGGPVSLVTADEHLPYNRPPLSKDYLRGRSEEAELPLEDEAFYRDHDIEVRLAHPAAAVDRAERTVVLADGATLTYETCVLATGGAPTPLPVPGGDRPDVFYLRSRSDGRRLRRAAEAARTAVVVGSGFIGCEAAASLAGRGVAVTLVTNEELPQAARLGQAAGDRLRRWLEADGVTMRLGARVEGIDAGRRVRLAGGPDVEGDLVLVAGGAHADVSLARAAGLTLDHDRVRVDARMRSSAPEVLAAGDAAFAFNASAGRHLAVEHWGEALAMGRVAGLTAAGRHAEWAEVPGFWSTIGDRTLKYAAWGDGFGQAHLVEGAQGAFTVWYERDGVTVGVATHDRDDDYELGQGLIAGRRPPPVTAQPGPPRT